MNKSFTSKVDIQNYLESACEKAVQNACNRLLGTLQELIDAEYYDIFEPDFYKRTYQFWKSATTKMLSQNCGEIFMNQSSMNYNSFWTAEKQLQAANIGSHGGWSSNETKEHRFWDAFENYCEVYARDILKEELCAQGLQVK